MLTINIDGASRGNPGPSGIGLVISRDGKNIVEHKEFVGNITNNLAEYMALKEALIIATTLTPKDEEIAILSDSELVVKQRNLSFKVRSKQLKVIFREINNLEKHFKCVYYTHVPRENNLAADLLANEAIDEYVLNSDQSNKNRQL